MDRINFETSHNVYLQHKTAGIFERIVASFIDLTILFFYTIILISILGILNLFDSPYLTMIFMLPVLIYDLLLELLNGGKSVGKMIMKIKVVSINGLEPTFYQYFLRWILRPFDIWLSSGGLAALVIFLNGKGQRLGDLAAGTTVISTMNMSVKAGTIYQSKPDNYVPTFPEVIKLSNKHINLCSEIIDAGKKYGHNNHIIDGSVKLKAKLEDIMGIKSDMLPIDFFRLIVNDYYHIHD
ncbi:MAG: RDD family protein [Candidatus Kapabacteria bacterium]|nr:RDD family protein [Candidatus Kapabacteria bacterium]